MDKVGPRGRAPGWAKKGKGANVEDVGTTPVPGETTHRAHSGAHRESGSSGLRIVGTRAVQMDQSEFQAAAAAVVVVETEHC